MRPVAGDDSLSPRSRTSSDGDKATPLARLDQQPMTFFLADEKSMEASLDRSVSSSSTNRHLRDHLKRSNFGVESIETIGSPASQDSDDQDTPDRDRKTRSRGKKLNMSRTSSEDLAGSYSPSTTSSPNLTRDASPFELRRACPNTAPLSATPSYLESPMLGSISTYPHTRQASEFDLTDDGGSQAILSSDDENTHSPEDIMEGTSSSQLVMPSIQMPSRRPFTDNGKNMGRIKILIAGDSGMSHAYNKNE